jgi:hypothetical protein
MTLKLPRLTEVKKIFSAKINSKLHCPQISDFTLLIYCVKTILTSSIGIKNLNDIVKKSMSEVQKY